MIRIKKNRTIVYTILSFVMMFMLFSQKIFLFAAEIENTMTPPDDFGEPISVTTYVDEDGNTVTDRTFIVLDDSITRSKSGSGWYKNEKTMEWTSGSVSTYYAQGYFTWGDGDVSVSSVSGGISSVSGVTITNRNTSSGTGRYGYIFNKYAYVTFSCTATSIVGSSNNLSVTIRVSESGNTI